MLFFSFLNAGHKKVEFHGALVGSYNLLYFQKLIHSGSAGIELGARINASDYFFITPVVNAMYAPHYFIEDPNASSKGTWTHFAPIQALIKVGGSINGFGAYGIIGGGALIAHANKKQLLMACFTGGAGVEYRYRKFSIFGEILLTDIIILAKNEGGNEGGSVAIPRALIGASVLL